jgi:hypothetical protein
MVRGCSAALAVLALSASVAAAQDLKSPDLAKQLAQLLDQKKMDAVATADPQNLGTYTAALYFPGSQLLVVSAKYAAPPLLNEKIIKKSFRDVYIDLSSASVAGTKLFVIDANADGLVAKPGEDQAADNYENAGKTLVLEGAKKAKMKDEDYDKAVTDADQAYCHMLQLLINQVNSGT